MLLAAARQHLLGGSAALAPLLAAAAPHAWRAFVGAAAPAGPAAPRAAPPAAAPWRPPPPPPQQQQQLRGLRTGCSHWDRAASASSAASAAAAQPAAAAAAAAAAEDPEAPPESVVAPLATPAAAAAAAAASGGAAPAAAADTLYSLRQVSKHASDDSCWIVVDGEVFDVTTYLDDHPGGSESILLNAGVDCSEEFNSIHSAEAKALLKKFRIGALSGAKPKAAPAAAVAAPAATAPAAAAEALMTEVQELRPPPPPPPPPPAALAGDAQAAAALAAAPVTLVDPRVRYDLPLDKVERLNHDTFLLRFALPSPAHRVGLPCGKHVFMFADIDGELVARAYTPLSSDRDLGRLDLLIKVYWANEHPLFPAGGKMTQHLARLKPGDTISVKGPMGKFEYTGGGNYALNRRAGKARWLSFVAGGSGITPCYAVIREALGDPSDPTRLALLYANKRPEDIWLHAELDELAARHPDRFHVRYVLEQPPAGWTGSTGRVTLDMLAQHLLPSGPESLALMCGPPAMLEHAVLPGLRTLGYGGPDREDTIVF